MERIMITGGCGFIGSHLAGALHSEVIIYDLKEGMDVRDYDTLLKAMIGVKTVYHLAAVSSIEEVEADPEGSRKTNITGTMNVLRAAKMQKVERIIFASSAAVYGESIYGWQKLAGEFICEGFKELNVWRLRLFNVYGPGANHNAVVPAFIAKAVAGEPLVIHGDGRQTRDMIHVSDVVYAMLKCGVAPLQTAGAYEIGSGKSISIRKIAEIVCGNEAVYAPGRPGDIRESQADISRARALLGWEPAVSFQKGIKMLCKENAMKRAA